jgi:hypothetical protein
VTLPLISTRLKEQLRARFRVSFCTARSACLPLEETMGTSGLNALATMRWGAFRVLHSGARDGFGFLLIGLAGIGAAVWAAARAERKEPAKNQAPGR